ncbi:hypothetical protein K438DRAFT_1968052 [Mycena galopus ATCC 62051]|nr:hypothetical protein K438DRAFT_1968052 [Mycena galopus ATCC 62051]
MNAFSPSTRLLAAFLLLSSILVLVHFLITLHLTVCLDPRSCALFPTLSTASSSTSFASLSLSPSNRNDRLGTPILGVLVAFGAVGRPTAPRNQDMASTEFPLAGIRDDLERKRGETTRRAAVQVCVLSSSPFLLYFRTQPHLALPFYPILAYTTLPSGCLEIL